MNITLNSEQRAALDSLKEAHKTLKLNPKSPHHEAIP